MGTTQKISTQSRQDFIDEIWSIPDEQLLAQDLVQQGAIHALSFLLMRGCTEEIVGSMLETLRANTAILRNEADRRGKSFLFEHDQVVFN